MNNKDYICTGCLQNLNDAATGYCIYHASGDKIYLCESCCKIFDNVRNYFEALIDKYWESILLKHQISLESSE